LEKEAAILRIGEAIRQGYPLEKIESDPLFETLKNDPRFRKILERSAADSLRAR
jgi:hypothetical protein